MKKFVFSLFIFLFMLLFISCNKNNNEDTHVHEPGEWTVEEVATCSNYGKSVIRCTECGEVLQEKTLEKLEHDLEYYMDQDPTCDSFGYKLYKCKECGEIVKGEEIEKLEHTVVIDEAVASTCTHTGLTEGSHCSVCGEVIVMQYVVPKLEHDYVLVDSKEATETEDGYKVYECSMCKATYTVNVKANTIFNEEEDIVINLSDLGSTVSNNNGGVNILNNTINITLGGTYILTGELTDGNIYISVGEDEEVDLELDGVTLISNSTNPIYMETGNKLEISAKSGTTNTIKDLRESSSDATGAAIYSLCDTLLKGKGELIIEATYNNGIHSKDDLKIKNLTLTVTASNNALKGNDSLTIESGVVTAISTGGDSLKTENSDVSSKGNQRGTITISDGTINLFATTDGIDASFNCIIDGGIINIYTDKYSSYSGDVEVTSNEAMYIRISGRSGLSSNYNYSALFINEDGTSTWCSGVKASTGRETYFKFSKPSSAKYVKFYCYSGVQTVNQSENYLYATDQLTITSSKDTYSISQTSSKTMSGSWTNYTTQGGGGWGGPGGMGDGNKDKTDYSCKGIKADNEIIINGGTINIKSMDDAIHANSDTLLDTGKYGSGNVTINNGTINIYSNDDGIHGDNNTIINGGNIVIENSYEGVEGTYIEFNGGTTQIKSSDDGINAKTKLTITDGLIYLDANGDGLDSNNQMVMTGGVVLALGPTNGGNGVIDFERSFSFSGGLLLAIGCSGMNQKPTASSGNTSTSKSISTTTSSFVNVTVGSEIVASIKVTKSSQNYCVLAYNNNSYPNASVTVSSSQSHELVNGLYYFK